MVLHRCALSHHTPHAVRKMRWRWQRTAHCVQLDATCPLLAMLFFSPHQSHSFLSPHHASLFHHHMSARGFRTAHTMSHSPVLDLPLKQHLHTQISQLSSALHAGQHVFAKRAAVPGGHSPDSTNTRPLFGAVWRGALPEERRPHSLRDLRQQVEKAQVQRAASRRRWKSGAVGRVECLSLLATLHYQSNTARKPTSMQHHMLAITVQRGRCVGASVNVGWRRCWADGADVRRRLLEPHRRHRCCWRRLLSVSAHTPPPPLSLSLSLSLSLLSAASLSQLPLPLPLPLPCLASAAPLASSAALSPPLAAFFLAQEDNRRDPRRGVCEEGGGGEQPDAQVCARARDGSPPRLSLPGASLSLLLPSSAPPLLLLSFSPLLLPSSPPRLLASSPPRLLASPPLLLSS
eukprot:2758334-Rhodomonas_salina.1